MKKLILGFFILLQTIIFSDENIGYISSFNILRLGANEKNYKEVGKILSSFDIVGLEEVFSEAGVQKVVDELEKVTNVDWDYHMTSYPVGTKKYKEHYAYVFRADRVKFLKSRGYFKDRQNDFIREPYGADFKIGEFDFTFVLVHSIIGKSESLRRAEAFKLNEVYDYFQDLDPKENDIILAGDFNLSAFDEAFDKLVLHKDKITYVLNPTIKTTLGKNSLASSYDNMFISKIYTGEFNGKSGALDFTNDNFREMKERVSDHLPIFIVVETEKDDD